MAEFQAGEVVVPVVPDATGFVKRLRRDLLPGAEKLGQEVGQQISRGISSQLTGVYEPLREQARRQQPNAQQDGAQVGGAFARGFRARLEAAFKALPKAEIDADSTEAQRKIAELRTRIETLSGKTVGVDIDAAAALAEVESIRRELATLDRDDVTIDVRADVQSALAELAAVDAALSRIDGQVAHARVDVDVSGALASLGMLSAAMAGLAAIPVAATLGAGIAALSGPLAAAGAGFASLAAVAIPSVNRIGEALKQQEQAQRAAASATSSATSTAQQAQLQAMQLADAEQRVADAKRAARAAEDELTRAREAGRRALEDMNLSLERQILAQKDAELAVREAEQRLRELQARGDASELEIERAMLQVEMAHQRAREQEIKTQRAKKDTAAANKAGVKGTAEYQRALEKVSQAEARVAQAEKQLAQIQVQQAAAARQSAGATRGITGEVVKLTPAAQKLAQQWKSFSDVYENWQKKLEPAVLPMLGQGLQFLEKLLPRLTPIIKGVSGALDGLLKSATQALGGPFWSDFFRQISSEAPTAVAGLGRSLGNVATGIAGIIKAFLPFTSTVVGGIEQATRAFADWGKSLAGSQGFQSFIAYVQANMPKVSQLFSNLATLGGNLVQALAPIGSTALAGLTAISDVLARMSPQTLQAIVLGLGGMAAGIKAASASMTVLNAVIRGGPLGWVLTIIGLIAGALITAYQNSETFRTIVDAVFRAIGDVVSWVWESVLKPAFDWLSDFIVNTIGPHFLWFHNNVVSPVFTKIGEVITLVWNNVIKPAFTWIQNFIVNTLGPRFLWFHNTIVKPTFDKIGEVVKFVWNSVIKPALQGLWTFITETLAPRFLWFHTTIVKPTFDKVGEAIKFAWDKVIKPVFDTLYKTIFETIPNGFKKGVELIGKAWDGVKEAAKKPVQFVIETVYNNGIVRVWNAVADMLKLPQLPPVKGFARGGVYPGYTPGRDIGLAAVSGGEAIMRPEWTRVVGEEYVHKMNAAARKGGVAGVARALGIAGDPGKVKFAGAFESGGIVGNLKNLLSNGIKWGAEKFLYPLLDQAKSVMGGSPWGEMLFNVPKRMVEAVIAFLGEKEEQMGGVKAQKAIAFAREQIGKPYKWGATGPDAYDCSGLVMRALQAAGVSGVPRVSQAQMKWVKPIEAPVPGALGFPHPGHVWIYTGPNSIIEAPYTGAYVREVAARSAELVGMPKYDSGGFLPPGASLVFNGTGRPEPVLTDQQWRTLQAATRGGDGPMLQIDAFYATPEQSPAAIARELAWLAKARG